MSATFRERSIIGTVLAMLAGYLIYTGFKSKDSRYRDLRMCLEFEESTGADRTSEISTLLQELGLSNCPDDIRALYWGLFPKGVNDDTGKHTKPSS